VIVVGVIVLVVTLRPPYANGPDIRSDGRGYHAWTTAILRGEFDFCGDRDLIETRSTPSAPNSAGRCPNKYPPGLALIELPIMAPLSLANSRSFEPSRAEHLASRWLGAGALIALCIVMTATCRRLAVSDWATHASVLGFVFGTGLFHYATYDNSFAHVYLALLFAALISIGIRSRLSGQRPSSVIVGVLCFLIVETREVDLLALAVLAGYWLTDAKRVTARTDAAAAPGRPRLQTLYSDNAVAAGAIGAGLAIAIEAIYATYATGGPALAAYSEQVDPGRLKELGVLVGYDHGLFSWYPVVAVALVLALAVRSTRAAGLWWAAAMSVYVLLYGSWQSPQLGGGFGHRGFVELMPGGIVVVAVALSRARRSIRVGSCVLGLAAVTLTLELLTGYWRGSIPFEHVTSAQYWSHVVGEDSFEGALLAIATPEQMAVTEPRPRRTWSPAGERR
jgi:hypothetical protein